MFFRKTSQFIFLFPAILIIYVFSLVHPAEAICKVISRIPVLYKYQESTGIDDSRNIVLNMLTGGTGLWFAECVIQVCKNSPNNFCPVVTFTDPNGTNELSAFIPSESYVSGFRAVLDGKKETLSQQEELAPDLYLYFKIAKDAEAVWSYVVFENKYTGYSSITEFGCAIPSGTDAFLKALDHEMLTAIATTL